MENSIQSYAVSTRKYNNTILKGDKMREIKFRAWDKERKEWQHFTLQELITGQATIIWPKLDDWCQYTGLMDRNGKEIYEGDVVRASIYCDEDAQVLEVKYRGTGFVIDYRDSEADYFMLSDFPGTVEVLGNIYENPELLK